jgi:hypothetical protein
MAAASWHGRNGRATWGDLHLIMAYLPVILSGARTRAQSKDLASNVDERQRRAAFYPYAARSFDSGEYACAQDDMRAAKIRYKPF